MEALSKRCFKCGQEKPLADFYRHPGMSDGHLNKCKDCAKQDVRANRQSNPERVSAYERRRRTNPERKMQRAEHHQRYVALYPDKRKAHCAVNNAVRDRKLTKEPCAVCGSTVNLQAHHSDYSRPLEVTWLCGKCHRAHHHKAEAS